MPFRLSATAFLFSLLCAGGAVAQPASTPAPAQEKVLRMFLSTSETGLDPAVASDNASLSLLENLFDPLLRYDYLARPAQLRPNTASAMPEVSADGLSYTFRIRPGIHFTPDPAFKGQGNKGREMTAQDYVYSIGRLRDPATRSPWSAMFEGVAELRALDRYTLRIRLKAPDNNFLFYLAMPASSAVAREVIEAYPGQAGNHPVGTGPFMIGEWKRSDRIVLLANPYSTAVFHATPGDNPEDRAIAAALEGKRLPRVDRVEVRIAEEFQGLSLIHI